MIVRKKKAKKTHFSNRYRSGLEDEIATQLEKSKTKYYYERGKIGYKIPASEHIYTPDFEVFTASGKCIIVEGKGIWVYEDRYKHLLIRQQHPELDIRFVFSSSKSKIRKGSKVTYADICEGRGRGIFKGVVWQYADKKIPKSWLEE